MCRDSILLLGVVVVQPIPFSLDFSTIVLVVLLVIETQHFIDGVLSLFV